MVILFDVKIIYGIMRSMKNNHVDNILQQWSKERPDLDTSPMAITGRIAQISASFGREMQETFSEYELNHASFDLLATLLRSGPPYSLSPSKLISSTMVTSGTMTNRIDRLEEAGLVIRTQNGEDKRSYIVSLTDKGYSIINQAIEVHVQKLHHLTKGLSADECEVLSTLLQRLISSIQ